MSESRVRENRTHGSIGGRWRNGPNLRGPLVPGRCAEKRHHHGLVGTSTAATIRQASGLPHRLVGVGHWSMPEAFVPDRWTTTVRCMAVQRMDHDGVVVDDLEAAAAFFL